MIVPLPACDHRHVYRLHDVRMFRALDSPYSFPPLSINHSWRDTHPFFRHTYTHTHPSLVDTIRYPVEDLSLYEPIHAIKGAEFPRRLTQEDFYPPHLRPGLEQYFGSILEIWLFLSSFAYVRPSFHPSPGEAEVNV